MSLLKQVIFWIIIFALTRTVFLLYNLKLLIASNISFTEAISSYKHALVLDLATACYLMLFPVFLLIIQSMYSRPWINVVNKIYTYLAIGLYTLLTVTELGIYPEWQTKLPFKALAYLQNPSEVYNSASTLIFILLVILFILQSGFSIWLYNRFFFTPIKPQKKLNLLFTFFFTIITLPLLVLGARGGVQVIPINQSEAYYSDKNILNVAAVNSGFNLFISIIENYKNFDKNPFEFYPDSEAKLKVVEIYEQPNDSTTKILTTNRPNVVLLILESWSADLIESITGEKGITPEFRELEKGGVLFTNLYATGPRSEQAMGSIFSGFPAHPISSVTVQPEKFSKLNTITKSLIDEGYNTSFYFGGQLRYGNIKGFILHNGFKRITELSDFKGNEIKGKLGVHDEFVLSRQLNELNNEKEPFFSALFTLSSHSPYDQPMKQVIDWGKNENGYLNSAYYTDKCLGDYFRNARKEGWYKNTLFIIVADHSHNSHMNRSFTTPAYHKIPMLFYGEVIKPEFRGQKIDRLSNQMDLAATLMNQLELDASLFPWSRDLFNPYSPEFSYYSFEEGLGWVTKNGYFVYEPKTNNYIENTLTDSLKEDVQKSGKSFLQVLFDEYMKL